MTDPLFGSVSPPLWPAIPAPAYGYVQSPLASSHRFGTIAPGSPAQGSASPGPFSAGPALNVPALDPHAFGGAYGGPNFATGLSAVVSSPLASGVPAFMGAETAIGVTAPALLTAVAMRRGQPLGPTNDQEVEDFIYDAFDLLLGTNDVEVRVEGGRAVLSGSVAHKRLKRDLGELAWAIPALNDVQNNVTITARRRSRANREARGSTRHRSEIRLIPRATADDNRGVGRRRCVAARNARALRTTPRSGSAPLSGGAGWASSRFADEEPAGTSRRDRRSCQRRFRRSWQSCARLTRTRRFVA